MIQVDNGKIFSARRLDAVCAALGIRKIHCPPYSPEGKGKIERFFREEKELVELFLWQVTRKVNNVGSVSIEGLNFEVDGMPKQRQV